MQIAGFANVIVSLLVVVALSALVAVGSVWLAGRFLDEPAGKTYNVSLAPFVTTAALVYGALLGFTVVVAWEQFSSATNNVSVEASTVTAMYRQTIAMPATDQAQIRSLIRRYATAAQTEWGNSADADDAARGAINDMYRVIGAHTRDHVASPVDGEFLSQLTTLSAQRNARLLDTKPRIPGLLWGGLLFGAVVVIGLLGFSRLPSRRGHMMLSSAVAILLGLLLFTVFWLDHPFGRDAGVTAAPFVHAIEVFDSVDHDN